MKLFIGMHRIETARLQTWNYAWPGWYYVTVCTKDKGCFFGEIHDEEMRLSGIGEIAFQFWNEIPKHFHHVELDDFEIMPNHIHGIIIIGDIPVEMLHCNVSTTAKRKDLNERMSTISPKPGSLGAIVRSFKSAVTKECRIKGFREFEWQERYYDHIIRSEHDVHRIRTYIRNNVLQWEVEKIFPEDFINGTT